MAVLFSANHETNSVGEYFNTQGAPTVVTTPVIRGTYALGCPIDATGNFVRAPTFTSLTAYMRFLFRINIGTLPIADTFNTQVASFENTAFSHNVGIYLNITTAGVITMLMRKTAGGAVTYGGTTITANTTYVVELRFAVDAANGVVEWRLNGTVIATAGPVATGTDATYKPLVMGYNGAPQSMVATNYIDAVLVRDDAYPGGSAVGDVFAPGLVGHGTASFTATANTALAPTLPKTVAAADVSGGLLHVMLCQHAANGPFTTPSGWSLCPASPTVIDDNNTTAQRVTVFLRRAQVGDTTPSVDLTTPGVTTGRGAVIIGVVGVAGTTNTDGVDQCTRNLNTATTNSIAFPSVTTTQQHDLVLALGAQPDNPTTYTTPAGWNQLGDAAFDSTVGALGMTLGYLWNVFTTGATGTFTLTTSTVTSVVSTGAILALKGVAVQGPFLPINVTELVGVNDNK